jgi:hypothetical protein
VTICSLAGARERRRRESVVRRRLLKIGIDGPPLVAMFLGEAAGSAPAENRKPKTENRL